MRQKEESLYAPAGHEMAVFQFPLDIHRDELEEREQGAPLSVTEDTAFLKVENDRVQAVFNKVTGRLVSLTAEGTRLLTEGPRMSVYRATIDNDMYKKEDWLNKYFIQKPVEECRDISFREEAGQVTVTVQSYFGCYNQSWGFDCTYEYQVYSCGQVKVSLDAKTVQGGKLEPCFLPRLGVVHEDGQSLPEHPLVWPWPRRELRGQPGSGQNGNLRKHGGRHGDQLCVSPGKRTPGTGEMVLGRR